MVFKSGNALLGALFAALVLSSGASAWAWPVDGPVLRPFASDGDPYAGGQHRGIDVGAPTGSDVRSAAAGVVSFTGRMPQQGICLTIRTVDGWSVTLVHLGSIAVPVGTQVAEGDVVGTIGPSGEPEGIAPYVHLGIRLTADPNGYVDPLTLLPPLRAPEPPPVQPPVQQPATAQGAMPGASARRAAPPGSAPRHPHPAAKPSLGAHRSANAPRHAATRMRASTRTTTTTVRAPRMRPRHGLRVQSAVRSTSARASSSRRRAHPRRARERREQSDAPVALTRRTALRPEALGTRGRAHRSRRLLLLGLGLVGLALVLLGLLGRRRQRATVRLPIAPPPLRKMSTTELSPEERLPEPSTTAHSRRRRVALREWPAASGTCRRLRRSVGHHGPLSPAAGRRRPDGQRHRRARHARHDRGRSRGSVPA